MIKLWEEFSNGTDIDYIKDIFLDIVDEWGMEVGPFKQVFGAEKIQYIYFDYPISTYRRGYFVEIQHILDCNNMWVGEKRFGIYIDISGFIEKYGEKNKKKFLDDLNSITKRINMVCDECLLLKNNFDSTKFLLFIKNK